MQRFTYLASSNPTKAISLINRELTLELRCLHAVVGEKLEANKKYMHKWMIFQFDVEFILIYSAYER